MIDNEVESRSSLEIRISDLFCYSCKKLFPNRDAFKSHHTSTLKAKRRNQNVIKKNIAKQNRGKAKGKCKGENRKERKKPKNKSKKQPYDSIGLSSKSSSNPADQNDGSSSDNPTKILETVHKITSDWKCNTCARYFASPHTLKRHEKLHGEEAPFTCMCGKDFFRLDKFRSHLEIKGHELPDFNNEEQMELLRIRKAKMLIKLLAVGELTSKNAKMRYGRINKKRMKKSESVNVKILEPTGTVDLKIEPNILPSKSIIYQVDSTDLFPETNLEPEKSLPAPLRTVDSIQSDDLLKTTSENTNPARIKEEYDSNSNLDTVSNNKSDIVINQMFDGDFSPFVSGDIYHSDGNSDFEPSDPYYSMNNEEDNFYDKKTSKSKKVNIVTNDGNVTIRKRPKKRKSPRVQRAPRVKASKRSIQETVTIKFEVDSDDPQQQVIEESVNFDEISQQVESDYNEVDEVQVLENKRKVNHEDDGDSNWTLSYRETKKKKTKRDNESGRTLRKCRRTAADNSKLKIRYDEDEELDCVSEDDYYKKKKRKTNKKQRRRNAAHKTASKINSTIDDFKCTACSKNFKCYNSLQNHMSFNAESHQRLTCPVDSCDCTTEFKFNCAWKQHIETNHSREWRLKWSHEKRVLHCKVDGCTETFTRRSKYSEHTRSHRLYCCHICGKTFKNDRGHQNHMANHSRVDPKPLKCTEPNCDKAFSMKTSLNIHIRTVHQGLKPYLCQTCGFETGQSIALQCHIRTHTGEKPYKCSYCPYASATNGALKQHIYKHLTARPHKCTMVHGASGEPCDKAFKDPAGLRNHITYHQKRQEMPDVPKIKIKRTRRRKKKNEEVSLPTENCSRSPLPFGVNGDEMKDKSVSGIEMSSLIDSRNSFQNTHPQTQILPNPNYARIGGNSYPDFMNY